MQSAAMCSTCAGRGQVPEKRCKNCTGTGRIKSDSKYTVKIPAGIDTGGTIRLSGYGESGGAAGVSGDLYVVIHVERDKAFTREGDNIYTDLLISYPQAVLGDTVEIDTLDGMKKIVIPDGVQSHEQIRLKGLGVPRLQSSGRGDHFVRVIVNTPKKVNKKVKQLLTELKEELK
jgi:molecular chaperone DnaJ